MSETLSYGLFGLLWLLGCGFMVYIIRSRKMQSNFSNGLKLILVSFLLGLMLLLLLVFA